MLRFTLRDLFWLTVVVAVSLGWGVSYANWLARTRITKRHAAELRAALFNAELNYQIRGEDKGYNPLPVDWELTTREIP